MARKAPTGEQAPGGREPKSGAPGSKTCWSFGLWALLTATCADSGGVVVRRDSFDYRRCLRTAVSYGSLNDGRGAPKAPAESDEQAHDLAEAMS